MTVHPLIARTLRFPSFVTLVGTAAVYGLARPARALPMPVARPFAAGGVVTGRPPYIVGDGRHEQIRPHRVVRDIAEQARFDAECARDAVADQTDNW